MNRTIVAYDAAFLERPTLVGHGPFPVTMAYRKE